MIWMTLPSVPALRRRRARVRKIICGRLSIPIVIAFLHILNTRQALDKTFSENHSLIINEKLKNN